MLNSLYYAQSLKWMVPAGFLLGSAPAFMSYWWMWRLLTVILPSRFYERGDEALYATYQRLVLFFYENYTGTQVTLYGDYKKILEKKENVIFISNHQSTVDWVIADMLAERQGTLGNIRYILKDGLKYFPLYGFYFRQHSGIYVKRSGKFKEDQAVKQLQEIRKHNMPFWMVVFPEGTRYNPDLPHIIKKSQQFAIEQGEVPYEQHLFPRVKALQLCVSELRSCTDAVYDITAAYGGTQDLDTLQRHNAPDLTEYLSGVCRDLHIHVRRIPISEVPTDTEDIKHWLYERFRHKDKLMQQFYSPDPAVRGRLGEDGVHHNLGLRSTFPTFLLWIGLQVPLVASARGRELYWKSAMTGIALGWGWMALS